MKNLLILILSAFLTQSCTLFFGAGFSTEKVSTADLLTQFEAFNIPSESRFELDSASYVTAVKSRAKTFESKNSDPLAIVHKYAVALDDLQAVQILYFRKDGTQIFKLVNCYVRKASDWNVDRALNNFPPKISITQLNEFEYDFDFLLSHIKTLDGKIAQKSDLPEAKYYAIVLWNSYLKRHSDGAIETLKNYNLDHEEKGIFTLFVNNQNSVIKMISKQRSGT